MRKLSHNSRDSKRPNQILESEKDALVLSNTVAEGEKKDFENNISKLEAQKAATDRQAEELNARVVELGAWNNSLEIQLKAANEQQIDITPFREQALLIRRIIY